jgi:F-type H+-transporting ATPase subunit delta
MIGNMTTIARPYAHAAFEYALEKNALAAWEGMLHSAASMVQNKQIALLLNNPDITTKQWIELFFDVLAPILDVEKKNFLHLLAEHKRLPILPDVAMLFANYRREHEKSVDVEVRSAVALDSLYQQKLVESLAKRLQRKVSLQCSLDPSLIGGIIVRAGDTVIDGSVRGKLNRLLESL